MKLSPRMQAIVTLVGRDDASWERVARELKITRSTIMVHVRRAMKRFQIEHRRPRAACVHLYCRLLDDPSPPVDTAPKGFVYVIGTTESPRRVKLGYTKNLQQRLDALSRASPLGLQVLRCWPGHMSDEARLHQAASSFRLHGEWFEAAATEVADRLFGGPQQAA